MKTSIIVIIVVVVSVVAFTVIVMIIATIIIVIIATTPNPKPSAPKPESHSPIALLASTKRTTVSGKAYGDEPFGFRGGIPVDARMTDLATQL